MMRFTLGIYELGDGIGFVGLAMGLFGIAEVISNLELKGSREVFTSKIGRLMPSKEDFRRMWSPILRGTALGSALGILPGGGPLLASFSAYALEKKNIRPRRRVRQGGDRRRGGAGIGEQRGRSDLVHSAAHAGHPVQRGDGADDWGADDPGHHPGTEGDHREARTVLGADRFDVDRQRHARDPQPAADRHLDQIADGSLPLSLPAIIVFMGIGVYGLSNSPFDVLLMAIFGILGVIFVKLECEPAPLILGYVLGPMMEENLRRALLIAQGDPTVLITRPISAGFLIAAAILLGIVLAPAIRKKREEVFVED